MCQTTTTATLQQSKSTTKTTTLLHKKKPQQPMQDTTTSTHRMTMQDTSTTHNMGASMMGTSSRRFSLRAPPAPISVLEKRKREVSLKKLLKKHFGSTKNKEVRKAIDDLSPHNPTAHPTQSPYWTGDFICHTIPEFPGRIKTENPEIIQYTLGRLSFGVFQPHNLVCTIRSVRQSIQVRLESKTGVFKTYEYPVMMDLTIHTSCQDLPAIVSHDAICYECPKQPQRMRVTFKGSTLMPSREVLTTPSLLQVWMETFQGAYAKAEQERGIFSRTFRSMMAWWFQMTFPNDEEMAQTHSVHFEMKRAPRGHLDVLYLSDTTRITKGNRGTLVVVEPLTCTLEEGGTATSSSQQMERKKEEETLELLADEDNHSNDAVPQAVGAVQQQQQMEMVPTASLPDVVAEP